MGNLAGLDWGSTEHAVRVIDDQGRVQARFVVPHSATGLTELNRQLRRYGPPEDLPVAVERPSGLIVDALVEAGFRVVPIHPNALKASRPRYSAAQGKTDPADAFILADLLRTDGHRFAPLRPLSDETRALRALVRTRDDLVMQRVAVVNQLRALLESFWPGAVSIFSDVASAIALAFLERYPTPQSAKCLGEKRLSAFLARHGYCGRRAPAQLLERLRSAPSGLCGDAESDAKGEAVLALVHLLQPLIAQIQQLTAAVEHAVAKHPDGPTIMSLPYAGRVNAAQILAELGDDRARFVSDQHLAALAGVAPITRASGKHRAVTFRWACNHRFRQALTTFADNSRRGSVWAAAIYQRARTRGCDHPHAVRILARAWLRVLWRCWHDRRLYDPQLHRGAKGLTDIA